MAGNNDYVTKADLKALRGELKGDMSTLRDDLVKAIKGSEGRLRDEMTELIRDTETKLLKAFYGFAEATQKHLSENERGIHGASERITSIERRVTDIEKRLNSPNAS